MKRIVYCLLLFTGISLSGTAQDNQTMPAGHKLQGLKIAYITKQVNLTSDEAEKFWPIYYSYAADLKKARQEKKNDVLALEENVLNIRKRYSGEFKKLLITDERVNKVLTADRDFNNVLRRELQQRMQMRNKRNGPPPA